MTPAQAALLTSEIKLMRVAIEDAVDRIIVALSSVH